MGILGLLFFSACSTQGRQDVDELNLKSYAYHYSNLDSTLHYADRAYMLAGEGGYPSGRAEALNNIAFVEMANMRYDRAKEHLQEILETTDNQIELLIGDVQQMRLCQRVSANRDFYMYRERATKRLKRINEERSSLSPRDKSRLVYAETEFAIVNSTYYYYVGMTEQSVAALGMIDPNGAILRDTAQYLNYLYNIGGGGIINNVSPETIRLKEIEYLQRCLSIARDCGCIYFEANAMEAMAEHGMGIDLAGSALMLFQEYGDIYQIAAAHRTIAACYTADGDYEAALGHLKAALSDTLVNQAPDLVASIHAQMGDTYLAMGDTATGQYYRELGVEILDETRRDRYYEAQASMLEGSVRSLDMMILAVVGAIVLLLILLLTFYRLNIRNNGSQTAMSQWQMDNKRLMDSLHERQEEIREETDAMRRNIVKAQQLQMEHRARLALVNRTLPFIDRIINEVDQLTVRTGESDVQRRERFEYISELTEKINEDNELLTEWIKMTQGMLSLHVESFPLQQLFDTISRSKTTFAMKGITLDVVDTDAVVKADKVLTLFMLNTLADNARKFTPEGGRVTVRAEKRDGCVEISVEDTGCGMSGEQLDRIFSRTAYEGHGFGLLNCRGIIEKYRKISKIFSVSTIAAESEEGRGSRFFFRLPKGVARTLVAVFIAMTSLFATPAVMAQTDVDIDNTLAEYCRNMQQEQIDRTIAVVLLALTLFAILPAYYVLYYRHKLNRKFNSMQEAQLRVEEELANTEMAEDELRKAGMEYNSLYVSNSVLDNCFSTLKHETMYYPNRIRHQIDTGRVREGELSDYKNVNLSDLNETVKYYRDLYFMLSQQAMQQVEQVKTDRRLMMSYLMDILRRDFRTDTSAMTGTAHGDGYLAYRLPLPDESSMAHRQERQLRQNQLFLVCRQIVREYGEATHRYGCGIDIHSDSDGSRYIELILPDNIQTYISEDGKL